MTNRMSTTSPNVAQLRLSYSVVASWVMVKTKTRSKKSSRVDTRTRPAGCSALVILVVPPIYGSCREPYRPALCPCRGVTRGRAPAAQRALAVPPVRGERADGRAGHLRPAADRRADLGRARSHRWLLPGSLAYAAPGQPDAGRGGGHGAGLAAARRHAVRRRGRFGTAQTGGGDADRRRLGRPRPGVADPLRRP